MSPADREVPVRLGPLADADLDADQRAAVERITSGPRGALVGPFVPLLRSPALMDRLQLVGAYLRYESAPDDDLVELAILVVARHWDQQFEWGHHQPLALAAGVPPEVVHAVEADRRPEHGRPEHALVWDAVTQLLRLGVLRDDTYAALLAALGEQALVDLVVTVGYYTTLALTMNAAGTPSPPDAPRMRDL
ncbi:carboxymuconolactone decarboxylase family protein [Nocardioides lentus]|uniref:Carboxymuconolactone decarboxylase family protein n=1 Tax=Nocardioides lentus TaxID=338077 RepID=A0ABP5A5Y9_9ACTN